MNQTLVSAGQNARPNLATPTSCPTNGQFAQSVTAVKNDTSKDFAANSQQLPSRNASNRQKTEPHARLTVADVKQGWLDGYFSGPGYLSLLFRSMKAEGLPIYIGNVAQFCQKWEIGERRFYRAKAKLVEQGSLEEDIQGNLVIWMISKKREHLYDDTAVGDSDAAVGNSDTAVSETDTAVSETPAKPLQNSTFKDSPDLNQISNISLSEPTHHPERESDISSSNKLDEEFREWLINKAKKLPKPPVFISQWAKAQMKNPEIKKEFLKYRKALTERINFPPAPIDAPRTLDDYALYPLAQFSEEEQRANSLARLQVKWGMDANARSSAIAEAEKLGFVITPIGIQEA
ncbi:MAG: hypothetical protein HC771_16280 [Synechococcales cyanobacterium CRU_2_2]|nr:hypothetical protein [Synechococcales cyanobacterium CRU_2_2]